MGDNQIDPTRLGLDEAAAAADSEPTSEQPGTGSKTIFIDGEAITIDAKTTVADVRDMASKPKDDLMVYWEGGTMEEIPGDDTIVAKYVDDGDQVAFQPIDTGSTIFG